MRGLLMLVGLLAAFAAPVCPAFADKRVALLIGNSRYSTLRPLANPANDVALLKGMLEHAGFDQVRSAVDLSRLDFLKALNAFTILARDSDIAVIYYSGHGMEMNGANFLPADTALEPDLPVQDQAVTLDRVLEFIQGAKRMNSSLSTPVATNRSAPQYDRRGTQVDQSRPRGSGNALFGHADRLRR